MPKIFPSYRTASVTDLTPEQLNRLHLKALLLDVDCTLKRYTEQIPEQCVLDWIAELRNAGIFLCLLSNGKKERIARTAERLGLPFIALALKPLPKGCRRALKEFHLSAEETAMVGDQLFADTAAGNLAGLTTILVTPIHPEEEHWFTRVKRPFEKMLLAFCPKRELPR